MNHKVVFNKSLIAPCGINCGSCIAYLREKNKCPGCRLIVSDKLKTRFLCRIKNCSYLEMTKSGYCYDCEIYPCLILKNLNKRYSTKYKTNLLENLQMIKEVGMRKFLKSEVQRRTCPKCGSTLSMHKDNCLICNYNIN